MGYRCLEKPHPPARSAPDPLAELLESFWEPKAGLTALPLKLLMLKELGLLLIDSAISANDILKGFFFWLSLLIAFSYTTRGTFCSPLNLLKCHSPQGETRNTVMLQEAPHGPCWYAMQQDVWMWHLRERFSGGPGRAGLHDLKGLSQTKGSCDSKMMWDLW